MQPRIEKFAITNTTKVRPPAGVPFKTIKERVLGKSYSLSLVIIGKALSQKLNKSYRGKNNPTNILSFPLARNEGEIFITLSEVRKDCLRFGRTYQNLTAFLYIHALLHLKGFAHGSTMEKTEQKLRKQFGI